MNISCPGCRQKYHVPDHKIEHREAFFRCEKCGEKIVVTAEIEAWSSFRPLSSGTLSAKDMLDGIFVSLNWKSLGISFMTVFFLFLTGTLYGLITVRNLDFAAGHPAAFGLISGLLVLFFLFIYDVHLYLVSLNAHERCTAGTSVKFGERMPDIFRDLKLIAVLAVIFSALLLFFLLPVLLLREGPGLTYAAIFFPVLISLMFLILFLFCFRGIFYAYIAGKKRNFRFAAAGLAGFLRVENINLLVYMFLTRAISAVVLAFFMGLWALSGVLLGSFIAFSALPSGFNSLMPLMPGRMARAALPAAVPGEISLILFVSCLIALVILSYAVSLRQTLLVASVRIMESNPGRSISRSVMIGICTVLTAFVLLAAFLCIKP